MTEMIRSFMARVVPSTSGCWEWYGKFNGSGYGSFGARLAHRASWLIFRGDIPSGKCVLHSCDNRKCVNPAHLFVGTYRDNIQDCLRKGRFNPPRGERNHNHIFTVEQVLAMRAERASGVSYMKIAERIGCHPEAVRRATKGQTWKHI